MRKLWIIEYEEFKCWSHEIQLSKIWILIFILNIFFVLKQIQIPFFFLFPLIQPLSLSLSLSLSLHFNFSPLSIWLLPLHLCFSLSNLSQSHLDMDKAFIHCSNALNRTQYEHMPKICTLNASQTLLTYTIC